MSTVRCGTLSGWRSHQHRDEKPCDACTRAKSAYDERRRTTTVAGLRGRLSARAQSRAYRRLAHLYPDLYDAFYAEEKRAAFAEEGVSL